MAKLLTAKSVIERKTPELKRKCESLIQKGLKPKLSVILVGDNPASLLYIKNKKIFCEKIGADFDLISMPSDTNEKKFLRTLNQVNNDSSVTGCFVQLPVPHQLRHINITQLIKPHKDVDGFHHTTVQKLYDSDLSGLIPCTPKGIITLLNENKIQIEGKSVTIIGRSHIVGKPLSLLLTALNATVTLCHSRTNNIEEHTKNADIIISAIGIPHSLSSQHISENQIIVDVGINKLEGKTVGDVDFQSVENSCLAITPVPGGVGPMTVLSLMENLIMATEIILERK